MTADETFPAYVVTGKGEPAQLQRLTDADLPEGDVTVEVTHSSLNYKDGLAVTGKGAIARRYPMVCGIDLAGTVAASDAAGWSSGDEVVLTGWGLSETHPGGYTTRQRVHSEWLVARPHSLNAEQSMAIGTAGLTGMLCVRRLEAAGMGPDDGPVLVTGASGGVGSVAVAVLAGLGYEVVASTGSDDAHRYLTALGASSIVDRADLAERGRPLQSERWSHAVDTVGSTTLVSVLSQVRYGGSVAACGLAGGNDLPGTVLPFILRNVSLLGVDSVYCPVSARTEAWRRLGDDLPQELLERITTAGTFGDIPRLAADILAGRTRGRVAIDVRR